MKRLKRYFKGIMAPTIMAPLFKLLEAFFELMVPLVVARVIDQAIPQDDRHGITLAMIVLLAMGVLGLASSVVAQYFAAKVATRVASAMKIDLYHHVSSLSLSEVDRLGVSTIETRLTADANQVQTGVNMTLRLFLRSPFIVFGALIVAFTIDVRSALVFAGIIVVEFLVVYLIMRRTLPEYRTTQANLDQVMGSARENLTGVRVIRAFRKEDDEYAEFKTRTARLEASQKKAGRISALLNPLTYVLVNLTIVFLVYAGSLRVNAGTLTPGNVIALYDLLSQILVELIKLANLVITMTRSVACANRIEECFATPLPPEMKGLSLAPTGAGLSVAFDRVSFSYDRSPLPVLVDVSFSAPSGATVGIIGSTGSGKSTLVSLIPRFHEADSGTITINGESLSSYDVDALRRSMAVVFQKAVLFRGTIRDNLKLGTPEATDEDLTDALKAAQAWEFVRTSAGGLDGPVTDGGGNFSGGEKQRLSIARALVRHPRLLILDDSASALDLLTERALRTALRSLPESPTLFIVSQRTSSLRDADVILLLEDGRVTAQGTHEQLLATSETYREIHHSQFPEEARDVKA